MSTFFDTLVTDNTIEEIESLAPCDWNGEDLGDGGKPCKKCAKWAVVLLDRCTHGAPIEPPHVILLCNKHREMFLSMMRPSAGFRCRACMCRVEGAHHIVRRITKL